MIFRQVLGCLNSDFVVYLVSSDCLILFICNFVLLLLKRVFEKDILKKNTEIANKDRLLIKIDISLIQLLHDKNVFTIYIM